MKKKIFWIVLLVLCISGLAYWYSYAKETSTPVSFAINAIPTNAAFVIESKKTTESWHKVSQTNIIWQELLSTSAFANLNRQLLVIDSLLHTSKEVEGLLLNNSLFVSAHVSGAYQYDFLFTLSLPTVRDQSQVDDFFTDINGGKEPLIRKYDGVNINNLRLRNNDSLNYAVLNGVLMISHSQTLVESAIRQLKSGLSFKTDKYISKIISTSEKSLDINFYLNYKYLPSFFNKHISGSAHKHLSSLSNFALFSAWDVTIKPNALLLSGFTQADNTPGNFLNIFAKQKPQEIKLTKVLPSSTALMMFWGISNVKLFNHDYRKYESSKNRSQQYEQRINEINTKYHINVAASMLDWVSNEAALVVTESYSDDYKDNVYAVFHSNDIEDAFARLLNLADTINRANRVKMDSLTIEGQKVIYLNLPDILPQLWGGSFEKLKNNYFCAVDDYIVFANTQQSLKAFISSFKNEKTLAKDKAYKEFSDNISSEAAVYLYSSVARSTSIYRTFVNNEIAADIEKNNQLFQKFDAFAIQFSQSNGLFYSNACLSFNPSNKKQNLTLWETKLDATVSSEAYLMLNHTNNTNEVFVQDDNNKLYLISNTGKILWTKQLNEKIMGAPVQVDAFKNKKLQLLFNTRSFIYLIDRNGKDLGGFPVKLKSPATNPLAVFDYENNRTYRILLASESKKIHCYEITGAEVKGFAFDKTSNPVKLPVQYFKANNKDHLCIVDEKGKIYILNRKGETIVKLTEHLTGCKNFFVEPDKLYSKTFIVGADSAGIIMKVSLTNQKETVEMESFDEATLFNYADVSGNDGVKEYLYISGNSLKVFTQNKSLLFEYEFKEKPVDKPLVFTLKNGDEKIGVVLRATNELYLFNSGGSLFSGFPLEGAAAFSIGDMNSDGNYNLVAASSYSSIFAYQLHDKVHR